MGNLHCEESIIHLGLMSLETHWVREVTSLRFSRF